MFDLDNSGEVRVGEVRSRVFPDVSVAIQVGASVYIKIPYALEADTQT